MHITEYYTYISSHIQLGYSSTLQLLHLSLDVKQFTQLQLASQLHGYLGHISLAYSYMTIYCSRIHSYYKFCYRVGHIFLQVGISMTLVGWRQGTCNSEKSCTKYKISILTNTSRFLGILQDYNYKYIHAFENFVILYSRLRVPGLSMLEIYYF